MASIVCDDRLLDSFGGICCLCVGLTSGERAFVENRIINIKERLVKNG